MFHILLKEFRLFTLDRRALMMTFLMPIVLISIFAMAFGAERREKAKPIELLVSDLDQSEASKNIIAGLDTISMLKLKKLPVDSAERLVKTGENNAVLVLNKGLNDSFLQQKRLPVELRYDQSRAAENGILQQALAGNMARIMTVMKIEALKKMPGGDSLIRTMNVPVKPQQTMGMKMSPLIEEKQNGPGLIQAVAGTAVMMLLFGLAALGGGMIEEKENGTLKRLLYSPIHANTIIFGKIISSVIIGLLQLSVLFLYASYSFHLDLMKNLPSLLLMMVATAFACSGFGVFLASVARSRQQVQMLSTLIVLSMSALGGSMIPTFLMPEFMQKISTVSVNYWSIQGFYDIYWRNLEFTDPAFLMRPLMLFAIGAVMMTISLSMFRRNVLKLM